MLCTRAAVLLRREGPAGLAKGVLRYIRVQGRRVAHAGDFYVYRYPIPCVDPEENRPRVDNLDVRVIDSLHDIVLLAGTGYEDPRMRVPPMEKRLAAGAVAVCGFVNRRLVYVGWVAMSEPAKRSFDRLPYDVAFDSGEAATGGAWTAPEYRGVGLYRYMFGRELALLRHRGRTVCCNAIGVRNRPSQRGQACYGAQVCARGRLLHILGRRRWTETPMSGPCPSLSGEPGGDT
ncbi:MAG: hypothetical protein M0R22_02365 [Dehalococcoidia bacterium]|nr:hypothetical protein [Dehalococcoidia bacterium]